MFNLVTLISAGIIFNCYIGGLSYPQQQESEASSISPGAQEYVTPTLLTDIDDRRYGSPFNNAFRPPQNKRRCPLCDSSVYPYCDEKLLHDACCCTDPLIYQLPYHCRLADCRFLHANSCKEHHLIANCCCSDDYRTLLTNIHKIV